MCIAVLEKELTFIAYRKDKNGMTGNVRLSRVELLNT